MLNVLCYGKKATSTPAEASSCCVSMLGHVVLAFCSLGITHDILSSASCKEKLDGSLDGPQKVLILDPWATKPYGKAQLWMHSSELWVLTVFRRTLGWISHSIGCDQNLNVDFGFSVWKHDSKHVLCCFFFFSLAMIKTEIFSPCLWTPCKILAG